MDENVVTETPMLTNNQHTVTNKEDAFALPVTANKKTRRYSFKK